MKLKTKLSKLRHDGHITDAEYTIIINVLNKFSTQPPKPKVGKWIAMGEGFTLYECSECEAVEFKKSKYCHNCGAYMGESEGAE